MSGASTNVATRRLSRFDQSVNGRGKGQCSAPAHCLCLRESHHKTLSLNMLSVKPKHIHILTSADRAAAAERVNLLLSCCKPIRIREVDESCIKERCKKKISCSRCTSCQQPLPAKKSNAFFHQRSNRGMSADILASCPPSRTRIRHTVETRPRRMQKAILFDVNIWRPVSSPRAALKSCCPSSLVQRCVHKRRPPVR